MLPMLNGREPNCLRKTVFDRNVLTIDIAGFLEALAECSRHELIPVRRGLVEKPDHRQRLLRTHCQRPCSRTAEQRDELAPCHSNISSARPDSGSGISMPSARAVFKLMYISTFVVACCTGKSAGLSPLRIRPA